MRNANYVILFFKKLYILFTGFFIFIFLIYGCSSTKPQFRVSQFIFNYEGGDYRIRSISSSDIVNNFNELLGKTFVAVDIDQDRYIDQIVMGEISLLEAQKIYDYGITLLTKEKKLRASATEVHQYLQENPEFDYEIKTFRPVNADPFNQFKIIDKHSLSQEVMILVDQKADGTLDEVLIGSMPLPEGQSRYSEVIQAGLKSGKLKKTDSKILVSD
jgi:hypothetical protein